MYLANVTDVEQWYIKVMSLGALVQCLVSEGSPSCQLLALWRTAQGQHHFKSMSQYSIVFLDEITALSKTQRESYTFSLSPLSPEYCKNTVSQSSRGEKNQLNYLIKCIWLLTKHCFSACLLTGLLWISLTTIHIGHHNNLGFLTWE